MLMGGVVSAPAVLGVLKGCTARPDINWTPEFLTRDQASLVTEVAEIIIPATDTPGAKDVGVPAFIDSILKDVYTEADQQRFLDGLKAFNDRSKAEMGDDFLDLSAEEKQRFVHEVHNAAIEADRSSSPPPRPFILMMKELTMLGFFTSEVGATQVLQYEPVPGSYKGCVPLSEAGNGRTWA